MLDDIRAARLKKKEALEKAGIAPYPASSMRTHTVTEVLKDFEKLSSSKKQVIVAGRILSWRDQGKLIFLDLKDESGKIQGLLKKGAVEDFDMIQANVEAGDFFELAGVPFTTKQGEKTIEGTRAMVLSKALRPIPTQFYGLKDVETRLRKRPLDILMNPEVKELLVKKALFWQTIRGYMLKNSFLEVETPVLELVPGGAEAEPFTTHHNALDHDFYLRISLELPLKRLMVAGFEKVFEIGRIFRNEGMSVEHLQDYTQMECYWAYADYVQMMEFTRTMYQEVIKAVTGGLKTIINGVEIDWGGEWGKVDYFDLMKTHAGIDLKTAPDADLEKKVKALKLQVEKHTGRGRLIDLIYKKTVRPTLLEPCFLMNPPVEVEPLAKRLGEDPARVARFQIMAGGTELGKGFSELNDPIDQRKRFEGQMALREKGDKEAQMLDEDYLEIMEYGMPPTAGFGLSERLFAVIMGVPVREAQMYPLIRSKE